MNKFPLLACLMTITTFFCAFSTPKTGSAAPQVEFTDHNGKSIKIADFIGKKLALVFLPSTSGWSIHCKSQACSIKTELDDLADYGISLICISADSPEKLAVFTTENNLNFPLLHANKNVIKMYGVDALIGIKRHTFLIDEKGIITKIITKVDIDNHAQQIIDGFDAA